MLQQDFEQEPTYIVESKRRCIELGMQPNVPSGISIAILWIFNRTLYVTKHVWLHIIYQN